MKGEKCGTLATYSTSVVKIQRSAYNMKWGTLTVT